MKRVAKYSAVSALGIVLIFILIVFFPSTETRYLCSGTLTNGGTTSPATFYLKITEYRWWVAPWYRSAGAVWLEVPQVMFESYGDVRRSGDNFLINDPPHMGGLFSTLSNTFSVDTRHGVLDGRCRMVDS